jgi:hypothetical protein
MQKLLATVAFAAITLASTSASAAITLNLVDSFARSSAFGLAYDGSNLWYSNSGGQIFEMTTSGVNTGNSINGPYWSALAYNGAANKLVTMQNGSITQFDRSTSAGASYTTLNPTTTAIAGGYGGLVDGLDVQGSTLWWSPDVDKVYNSPIDGSGVRNEFLGGAGGYSGVEYLSVGSTNYVIVVNDASAPRRLCVHDTSALELGCTALANSRYEDLAFDGRYLYAADFFGNRIDKIDVLSDGGSIFVPGGGGIPEPTTWAMLILGFAGIGGMLRSRRRQTSLAA